MDKDQKNKKWLEKNRRTKTKKWSEETTFGKVKFLLWFGSVVGIFGWVLYDDYFFHNEPDWKQAVQMSSLAMEKPNRFSNMNLDTLSNFLIGSGFWANNEGPSYPNRIQGVFYPDRLAQLSASELRDIINLIPHEERLYNLQFNLRVAGAFLRDSIERHAFTYRYLIHDDSDFISKENILGQKNRFTTYSKYLDFITSKSSNAAFSRAAVTFIQTLNKYELTFYLKHTGFIYMTGAKSHYAPEKIKDLPLQILKAFHENIYHRSSTFKRYINPTLGGMKKAIEMNTEGSK